MTPSGGAMRTLAAICIFLFVQPCFAAVPDRPDLRALYDARRWFELRDAVAKGGAPVFYQGVVACAFNDLRRCEKKMGAVIRSNSNSDEVIKAHKHLASAYLTHGKNREALAQIDVVLTLKPDESDARNVRPLLAALSEFPDQEVARRASTTLDLQEAGLPITINGVQATYWFDTGANYSLMSESEAKRFGLTVRAVSTKMAVSTGAQVDFKIAIAAELSLGSFRLKHVAFLVASDDQPPFNEDMPGSRGLIGIPVLLALQRFAWASKKFEIGSKAVNRNVLQAELCFDENDPITQVQFENRTLTFVLDTGATNTDLYPPFAAAFPALIREAAKTDSYKTEGVGSVKYMDAAILPSVHLSIGGFPVVLSNADVLLKPTGDKSNYFEGNLGIDLLQQAHKTTFDFKAMTLTLQ
jgi:predicted aspartyl protease